MKAIEISLANVTIKNLSSITELKKLAHDYKSLFGIESTIYVTGNMKDDDDEWVFLSGNKRVVRIGKYYLKIDLGEEGKVLCAPPLGEYFNASLTAF